MEDSAPPAISTNYLCKARFCFCTDHRLYIYLAQQTWALSTITPGLVMMPCGMLQSPPIHRNIEDFPAPCDPTTMHVRSECRPPKPFVLTLCPVNKMDEPFSNRKLRFSTSLTGGVLNARIRSSTPQLQVSSADAWTTATHAGVTIVTSWNSITSPS